MLLSHGYFVEFCLVFFLTFAWPILLVARPILQSNDDFFHLNVEYFWKGNSNRCQTFYRIFLTKFFGLHDSHVSTWGLIHFYHLLSCVITSRLLYYFLFAPEMFLYVICMSWYIFLLWQSISLIAVFFSSFIQIEDLKGMYRLVSYVCFSFTISMTLMHVFLIVFLNIHYFK